MSPILRFRKAVPCLSWSSSLRNILPPVYAVRSRGQEPLTPVSASKQQRRSPATLPDWASDPQMTRSRGVPSVGEHRAGQRQNGRNRVPTFGAAKQSFPSNGWDINRQKIRHQAPKASHLWLQTCGSYPRWPDARAVLSRSLAGKPAVRFCIPQRAAMHVRSARRSDGNRIKERSRLRSAVSDATIAPRVPVNGRFGKGIEVDQRGIRWQSGSLKQNGAGGPEGWSKITIGFIYDQQRLLAERGPDRKTPAQLFGNIDAAGYLASPKQWRRVPVGMSRGR